MARELNVEAERAGTVGRLRRGAYARIDVTDTGVGMSAAQVERIFDPFFTTKPVGQGTGLGLSLVHGIVLDHGAALEVASRSGAGTTFSVYLPLAQGEPYVEPRPAPAPTGRGETILVVDDEESLVHLAEEVLASLGYEPVGCVGAAQALQGVPRRSRIASMPCSATRSCPTCPAPSCFGSCSRLRPDLLTVLVSGYGGPDLQAQAEGGGRAGGADQAAARGGTRRVSCCGAAHRPRAHGDARGARCARFGHGRRGFLRARGPAGAGLGKESRVPRRQAPRRSVVRLTCPYGSQRPHSPARSQCSC